jgi:two-component system cell cycle response regulator
MKVLVADDAPVSRRLLEIALTHEGYEVVLATDGAEALRILAQEDCPRLVILDWMMPKVDGVEVCREIRKQAREPYVYFILLSAKGEQSEIIEGLEAGADDYMIKPFDLSELKARVRSGRRILDLEEQLLSARELLRLQATHDSLTGLLNRAAILETLQKELARASREGTPVSIIAADLDHFKNVNDTYGHQAGDAVLVEATQRMQASLRTYDAIGRCGGEEFLVVTSGCDAGAAAEQAERLRQLVSARPVQCVHGTIPVTVSLGVATTAGDLMHADELLRAADEALYMAKKNGRNRVEVGSLVHQ